MPGQELVSNIIDEQAVKAQLKVLTDGLKEAQALIVNMPVYNGGGKNDSFSQQREQINKLSKANDELLNTHKKLKDSADELEKVKRKLAESESKNAKEVAFYNSQLKENNSNLKLQAQLQNAINNSIEEARLKVKDLTRQRDLLNLTTEAGKKNQQELNAQIDRYNKFISENTDKQEKQRRNVGNYTGAISILEKSLTDVSKKIDDFTKSGNANADQLSHLKKEQEFLQQVLNKNAQGFASLTMEVRANERALATMFAEGMKDGAYKELEQQISNAKRELGEFKEQQKILSSQTPAITAASVAVKGLAGMYAVGAGAAALFGDEEGKIEKEVQKLVAVMTVLQGLQEAHELLEKQGTIAKVASTIATKVQITAQKIWEMTMLSSTAATVAFRVALIAVTGGLLLLVPLLAFASDAMSKSAKESELMKESLEDVNKEYKNTVKEVAEAKAKLEDLTARTKQSGLTFKEKQSILQDYNKEFGDTIGKAKNYNELESILINKAPQYIKMLELKAKAQAALNLAQKEYEKQLLLEVNNKEIENAKNSGTDIGSMVYEASIKAKKEATEKANSYSKLQADFERQMDEIKVKNHFEAEDAKDTKTKDTYQKSKDYAAELKKIEAETVIQRLEILSKYYEEVKNNSNNEYDDRVRAAENLKYAQIRIIKLQFDAELAEIKKKEDEEIKLKGLTEKEKTQIHKIAEAERVKASEKASSELTAVVNSNFSETKNMYDEAAANFMAYVDKIAKGGNIIIEQNKKYIEDLKKAELDRLKLMEEGEKKLRASQKELADESINFIKTLVDGQYEQQKNQIQELINAQQEQLKNEIDAIDKSTLSQQDKAAKIAIIEAKAQAEREALQKKQKDLDIKKAQFDKAVSIAKIIEETAIAVVKALQVPFAGIALAATIGAIGAVQLGTVLATPIPKYATGTDNHPGGAAIVGEGKHKELVELPSGESFIADKPLLLPNLPARSKVTPLNDGMINQMMYDSMIKMTAMSLPDNNAMQQEIKTLRETVIWQTEQLKMAYGKESKPSIINNYLNLGWADYLDKQVYNKRK